jgi:intergrase/recombinase
MDTEMPLRHFKRELSEAIEKARSNGEDLHIIEAELRRNLHKLKQLEAEQYQEHTD